MPYGATQERRSGASPSLRLVFGAERLPYGPPSEFVTLGDVLKVLKSALLGATILVGATVAASAADVYERGGSYKDTPAYVPVSTWAGFYAGIHAGGSFGDGLDAEVGSEEGEILEIDNAFVGGVQVGYNWQTSRNLVLGVEAALGLLNDDVEDVDITDYLASVRARLGYSFDRTLVYATGGVAFLGYSDEIAPLFDDDVATGFVVGGGIDHKLTDKISIGVEGLYYNFSSDINPAITEAGVDLDRDFWTVQARLNYHFGSRHDEALK
jgi:outer membrane immunogenic protein